MEPIRINFWKTPYGELMLGSLGNKLCLCDWRYRAMRATMDKRLFDALGTTYVEEVTPIHLQAQEQLTEYFARTRTEFTLDLLLVGTEFQKAVWRELITIPYGTTVSYLSLAQRLGQVSALRAVASANGANIHSIIIPCHRVIGSNGDLTGYAGGLATKQKLLDLESAKGDQQLNLW